MRGSLQAYKKVSVDSQLSAASPHKVIQMLMAGAIERLIQGKAAMQAGNIPAKGERLGKALDIIIALRSCLSMEDGGDIASNLDSLYEFMITQISAANHQNDHSRSTTLLTLFVRLNRLGIRSQQSSTT